MSEQAVVFSVESESLAAILHVPEQPAAVGILIVVGGGQYRVGSHRQFVLLARQWAGAGFCVFRFDCRGMGDASGVRPGFEHLRADLEGAIRTFRRLQPQLTHLVLFGLCDGASAAMIDLTELPLAAAVLVNPWFRDPHSEARTRIRHYYLSRLLSRGFWRKLAGGGWNPARTLRELTQAVRTGYQRNAGTARSFKQRMLEGVERTGLPVLLVVCRRDLTGQEFWMQASADPSWCRWFKAPQVQVVQEPEADHTFSRHIWLEGLGELTANWIRKHLGSPYEEVNHG